MAVVPLPMTFIERHMPTPVISAVIIPRARIRSRAVLRKSYLYSWRAAFFSLWFYYTGQEAPAERHGQRFVSS